jgi:hypothetical protein
LLRQCSENPARYVGDAAQRRGADDFYLDRRFHSRAAAQFASMELSIGCSDFLIVQPRRVDRVTFMHARSAMPVR